MKSPKQCLLLLILYLGLTWEKLNSIMQKWLDYYGPFEAVVDGANVGLFSQKKFIPSKASCLMLKLIQHISTLYSY